RARKPVVAAPEAVVDVAPVAPAVSAVSADGGAAGEGQRKPRRRRGGRGRRPEGVPAGGIETAAQGGNVAEGNRAPRGERRPPRERGGATEAGGNGHQRPSRQVEATSGKSAEPAHLNKPSLFRRLTRLFTGR
ncbi:MAG: ATP-dependent RNA helicase RhlB, partial [Xanthomonadaceae bacterium]|nr:ATP-dependent RNA helicase RhlB [Xanthomonadaceae bacterium]